MVRKQVWTLRAEARMPVLQPPPMSRSYNPFVLVNYFADNIPEFTFLIFAKVASWPSSVGQEKRCDGSA
jgi:hypothetical protein